MKAISLAIFFLVYQQATCQIIPANPSNYSALVAALQPGDTLLLDSGTYTAQLKIFNLVGTASDPIVLIGNGDKTIFEGNACCNTVSMKASAYVELHNILIDGLDIPYIDAIKAEGTSGNWAHHIMLDSIHIIGHGGDQQTVGISTKCTTWDWIIRHCTIEGAGTGLYLGNSDGSAPFVNGLIEYNVVLQTIGYNMEIKHQNINTRTIPGMTLNGKTIIRHNVFSKVENASTGGNARPNVLVGNFPSTGDGANDLYEIYGNLFWQNPVESLFQGTGNIAFYNNICVNHVGGNGVTFQNHNNFAPRTLFVFNNTIIGDQLWGIRLLDTDPAYQKYVIGNAVFSDHATPIRIVGGGVQSAQVEDNITSTMMNADNYITNTSANIELIDVYPTMGSLLKSTLIQNTVFNAFSDFQNDFNGNERDWTYRGAYTGQGVNPGWKISLEQKQMSGPQVDLSYPFEHSEINLFPNPVGNTLYIRMNETTPSFPVKIQVIHLTGQVILEQDLRNSTEEVNVSTLLPGIYLLQITFEKEVWNKWLIKS